MNCIKQYFVNLYNASITNSERWSDLGTDDDFQSYVYKK